MPNVNKIQGTPNTIVIGTQNAIDAGAFTGITGLIESVSIDTNSDKQVITGNDGWDKVIVYFNTVKKMSIDAIFDAGVTLPNGPGYAFSGAGVSGAVDSWRIVWGNKTQKKVSFDVSQHLGVTYS